MLDSPLMRALLAAAAGVLVAWLTLRSLLRAGGTPGPTRNVIWPALRGGRMNLVPLLAAAAITVLTAQSVSAMGFGAIAAVGGITFAAALANGLYFLPVLRSQITPYTGLASPGNLRAPSGGPIFDIFLSYKAEDERYVRPIADWMIACGKRPWFDEYLILLSERDRFAEAIDFGLRSSRWAVVFLNERYATGGGTLVELRGLIEHMRPGRTLVVPLTPPEVSLPDDLRRVVADFPQPTPPLPTLDATAIAGWLAERIPGLGDSLPDKQESAPFEPLLRFRGSDWQLRMADWQEAPPGEPVPGETTTVGDELVRAYVRTIAGVPVFWTVVCGTMTSDQTLRRELLQADDPSGGKRDMQQLVAELAREFVDAQGSPCVGVHLFFLDAHPSVPQFAMTYRSDAWVRLYSIVLSLPDRPPVDGAETSSAIQFDLQFFVQGTFADYCRAAPYLDRMVRSLSRREETTRVD